jgi:hypothetical protein
VIKQRLTLHRPKQSRGSWRLSVCSEGRSHLRARSETVLACYYWIASRIGSRQISCRMVDASGELSARRFGLGEPPAHRPLEPLPKQRPISRVKVWGPGTQHLGDFASYRAVKS